MVACGNDLGLFAEQIDAASREQLGNFPQAFARIGLVNPAWRLTDCTPGRTSTTCSDAPGDTATGAGPLAPRTKETA